MKAKLITPEYYWVDMLRHALYVTGYLPKELYYLVTTSKDLQKYITAEILQNWYEDDDNLDLILTEIHYTRMIDKRYFSQSNSTVDLDDIILQANPDIEEIKFHNDELATIIYR